MTDGRIRPIEDLNFPVPQRYISGMQVTVDQRRRNGQRIQLGQKRIQARQGAPEIFPFSLRSQAQSNLIRQEPR